MKIGMHVLSLLIEELQQGKLFKVDIFKMAYYLNDIKVFPILHRK